MKMRDYHSVEAISRSMIWEMLKHPKKMKALLEGRKETSHALKMGDAFDVMMFDNEKVLNERFHFMQNDDPYAGKDTGIGRFMSHMKDAAISTDNFNPIDHYFTAYQQAGIKRPGSEAIVAEFESTGGRRYVEELSSVGDKLSLDMKDFNMLTSMKYMLLASRLRHWFVRDIPEGQNRFKISDKEEVIYQQAIYFNGSKVLLDILYIDHESRCIRGIDLKTTSSDHKGLMGSIIKYGYFLQAAMYSLALEYYIQQNEELKDYSVDYGFSFVFVHKGDNAPLQVDMNADDVKRFIYKGGTIGYTEYPPVTTMIDNAKWHIENDKWEYERAAYGSATIQARIFNDSSK